MDTWQEIKLEPAFENCDILQTRATGTHVKLVKKLKRNVSKNVQLFINPS